jgi:hypothetical protein
VHELIRQAVAQTLYDTDRPSWKPIGFQEMVSEKGAVAEKREEFGRRKWEGGGRKEGLGRAKAVDGF